MHQPRAVTTVATLPPTAPAIVRSRRPSRTSAMTASARNPVRSPTMRVLALTSPPVAPSVVSNRADDVEVIARLVVTPRGS